MKTSGGELLSIKCLSHHANYPIHTPLTPALACFASKQRTLPLPRHHLPARPPARVCVHISANTWPRTESSFQSQPPQLIYVRRILSTAQHLHMTRNLWDETSVPIEPYAFWDDISENLEEFFGLPDTKDDIPIDPVILANHWPPPVLHSLP